MSKNIVGRSELDHALIALAAARAKTQRMACAKIPAAVSDQVIPSPMFGTCSDLIMRQQN